jgi:hypothetical protein
MTDHASERETNFRECEYPNCTCPRHGRCMVAKLADEYEAGLRKMEAAGYEEFAQTIIKHRMVIAALRAPAPVAVRGRVMNQKQYPSDGYPEDDSANAAIPREQDAKPVAWMNSVHIEAYQSGQRGGVAWTSPMESEFYNVAVYAAPPSDSPGSAHQPQGGDAREDKLRSFLSILAAAGGQTSGNDDKWNWINYFCDDAEPLDTFNQASKRKLTRVTHDSDTDNSVVYLTDAGRAFIATPPAPVRPQGGDAREHEIVALPENWPYARKKASIQVIVAREMMKAGAPPPVRAAAEPGEMPLPHIQEKQK